jgi:murein DD-endopeptidase MepM/ murein hydrolase activator NlpD
MVSFGIYLFKVSACLAVFYLLYSICFRNNTFFFLNRYYLLLGLIASFAIPLIKLPAFTGDYVVILNDPFQNPLDSLPDSLITVENASSNVESISFVSVFMAIYLLGVTVMFIRLIIAINYILKIKANAEIHSTGKFKILKTQSSHAFSFLTLIFIPKFEDNPLIIEHEKIHVLHYHWIDLLFVEIASLLLWFNPLMIFYKKAIKVQHEYLADAYTIANGNSIDAYLTCMLQTIQHENSLEPISPFYYSNTFKKRIIMITKNKTQAPFSAGYTLLLPVIGLLLFAFSERSTSPLPEQALSGAQVVNKLIDDADENKPSIAPVDMSKVTAGSAYGQRINPLTKKKQMHTGIDFTLAEGEPVMATADGIVTESKYNDGRGNYIHIKHSDVYSTQYIHLKSSIVKAGDKITKGQTIGYVGNTGLSVGPHLHYEVIKNGQLVDPKDYLPKQE